MLTRCGTAGNPIVPGVGLTRPHIVIYGNRAYLYAPRDYASDNNRFGPDGEGKTDAQSALPQRH